MKTIRLIFATMIACAFIGFTTSRSYKFAKEGTIYEGFRNLPYIN